MNVTVTNVLNDVTVDIVVEDIQAAVQLCASIELLSARTGNATITCEIDQTQ